MKPEKTEYSRLLTKLRRKAGFSYPDAATKLFVGVSELYEVEHSIRPPFDSKTHERLAIVYKLTEKEKIDLISLSSPGIRRMLDANPNLSNIFVKLSKLSEKDQKAIFRMIEDTIEECIPEEKAVIRKIRRRPSSNTWL